MSYILQVQCVKQFIINLMKKVLFIFPLTSSLIVWFSNLETQNLVIVLLSFNSKFSILHFIKYMTYHWSICLTKCSVRQCSLLSLFVINAVTLLKIQYFSYKYNY